MANKIDKINVGGADYEINLPTGATPTISSLTVTGNLTVSGTANLSVINCGEEIANYYDTLAVKGNPLLLVAQDSVGQKQSLVLTGDSINFQCNTFSINLFSSNTSKNVLYITNEDIALKLGVNFTSSTGAQTGSISATTTGLLFTAMRLMQINSPAISIAGAGSVTLSAGILTLSASSSLSLKKGSYTYSLPNKTGTIALTTDIKQLYLLTLYWDSKDTRAFPNITANMYVSHLASGLSLAINTFSGAQLSHAVNDILFGDYFTNTGTPHIKIVANGYSIYDNSITICDYISYDSSWKTLVANLTRGTAVDKVSLSDMTSFDSLTIFVYPIL